MTRIARISTPRIGMPHRRLNVALAVVRDVDRVGVRGQREGRRRQPRWRRRRRRERRRPGPRRAGRAGRGGGCPGIGGRSGRYRRRPGIGRWSEHRRRPWASGRPGRHWRRPRIGWVAGRYRKSPRIGCRSKGSPEPHSCQEAGRHPRAEGGRARAARDFPGPHRGLIRRRRSGHARILRRRGIAGFPRHVMSSLASVLPTWVATAYNAWPAPGPATTAPPRAGTDGRRPVHSARARLTARTGSPPPRRAPARSRAMTSRPARARSRRAARGRCRRA